MSNKFVFPKFGDANLELRYENDVVCIYGTEEGLNRLSELILHLVEHPGQGHIHLENEGPALLTKSSQRGAIAIFSK
jgi:hypothetical protein